MSIHGPVHRTVLMTLLVVCAHTVYHAIPPIAAVRVGDVLGRVHDLGATVGVFEQLCKLPPREFYVFMTTGGVLERKV